MRFVECCNVTVVVMTLNAGRGVAQTPAPIPAGVTRSIERVAVRQPVRDSSDTSLRVHMVRGVGSFFGYMYHVNANEERAARCKASPAACA